jgi:hypothetical protein
MAQSQSFLPIFEARTKIIHGMVAISSTPFDGDETTIDIGGQTYSLVKNEPVSTQNPALQWHMALTMTYDQFRKENYKSIPGFIPLNDILPGQWWTSTNLGAYKHEQLGALINGLLFSFGGNFTVIVEDDPVVDDSAAAYSWTASVPFANYPQCSFFDLNWVEAVQLDNDEGAPVNLVITDVTDELDAPQSKLKAVVVIKGQPELNRATYNTIRLVKMPLAIVEAGEEYKIKATIYGQNGFQEDVEILVTIE